MTQCHAQSGLRSGPLYFFDQPTSREPEKYAHRLLAHLSQTSQRYSGNQTEHGGDEERQTPDPSPSARKNQGPLDWYKTEAPDLLEELAQQLSLHPWAELGCLPRGIENILDYSMEDQCSRGPDPKEEEEDASELVKVTVSLSPLAAANSQVCSCLLDESSRCFSCDLSPGWTVWPQQRCRDAPDRGLCQWAVARLRQARGPEQLQTGDTDHQKPLILRYYGDAKFQVKDTRVKSRRVSLVNWLPQIPEVIQQNTARKKLHYRLGDGSAFIYYPSGHVAVCQSYSGLLCGGLYTNIFSDSGRPVILSSITMYGRGAVTHPVSGAVKAVWDQDGGYILDLHGNISEEWSWKKRRQEVVVMVSEIICVQLLSGTSAVLSFKCDGERVQLPLAAVSVNNLPKEMLPQVAKEVEETSVRWRRGRAAREMQKLQQRARNILDDWSNFYRAALGIKCPHREQKPDAQLMSRRRREVQSAVLPSLHPPADVQLVHPDQSRCGLEGGQSRQGGTSQERTCKRRPKEHLGVTRKGPLVIYGNIKPESVIISSSPELQTSAVTHCPVQSAFSPSVPLTVCPPLLRAALLGEEEGRKRCCCSAAVMPVVTDLDYDDFIMGQPAQSQQILVVCVTRPVGADAVMEPDLLEQLYRRKNKNRTRPCTQCQVDSFRLVRYEVSPEKFLLQRRHGAAPGMLLMYLRGTLLFAGNVFSDGSCSIRSLERQISKSRRDHRSALSLSAHYRLSSESHHATNAVT